MAYGKAEDSDELADITVAELKALKTSARAGTSSAAPLVIDRSGSFGYTVRVLPKHDGPGVQGGTGPDRQRLTVTAA